MSRPTFRDTVAVPPELRRSIVRVAHDVGSHHAAARALHISDVTYAVFTSPNARATAVTLARVTDSVRAYEASGGAS